MYQDLLKDTAVELEQLKRTIDPIFGDGKLTVSILAAMLHALREVDKRVDDLARRIEELERRVNDHRDELAALRRRLERRV